MAGELVVKLGQTLTFCQAHHNVADPIRSVNNLKSAALLPPLFPPPHILNSFSSDVPSSHVYDDVTGDSQQCCAVGPPPCDCCRACGLLIPNLKLPSDILFNPDTNNRPSHCALRNLGAIHDVSHSLTRVAIVIFRLPLSPCNSPTTNKRHILGPLELGHTHQNCPCSYQSGSTSPGGSRPRPQLFRGSLKSMASLLLDPFRILRHAALLRLIRGSR